MLTGDAQSGPTDLKFIGVPHEPHLSKTSVVGWITPPPGCLLPNKCGICQCDLIWQKNFVDMTKLKISRWGMTWGFSQDRDRRSEMMMEATLLAWTWREGHRPQSEEGISSCWERQGPGTLPGCSLQRGPALPTPWLWPPGTQSDFWPLTSRVVRA